MRISLAFLLLVVQAFGATKYVSQGGGVFSGGTACNGQTAVSIATFNGQTPSAGDVNYFCGTLTTVPQINASGSSGNVISFIWDTSARISVTHGQMINLNGATAFLLFDGGTSCGPGTSCDTIEAANTTGYAAGQTGIIEATANGSGLANQDNQTQAFWGCNGCHDIEIRNLIIRNLYQHTSTSDGTGSADTGDFTFQCPGGNSGCASGAISIHDSTIHDNGNAISIQKTSSTTVNIYNIDFYRNNWAVENSGNGTRTFSLHDSLCHDTTNWDTLSDAFHHNCLHNYTNTASDSISTNIYNMYSYGNWGTCCTTDTLIFMETDFPNNVNVYNNICIQQNSGTAPCMQVAATTGLIANNVMLGSVTSGNVEAVQIYGTGFTVENNAVSGYGQFIVVDAGVTITAMDYNQWGTTFGSGNSPWSWKGTGENTFSAWKSGCSCDSHGANGSLGVNSVGIPQIGSALIGAGVNLTNLSIALLNVSTTAGGTVAGSARPSVAAWDIGAYQYQPPAGAGASISGGGISGGSLAQ